MSSSHPITTQPLDDSKSPEKFLEATTPADPLASEDNSANGDIDGDYGSYGDHVFSDPKVNLEERSLIGLN